MRTENVPGFHNLQVIGQSSGMMGQKPKWNGLRVSQRSVRKCREQEYRFGITFGHM